MFTNNYYKYERGEISMMVPTLLKILDGMDVTLGYFAERVDNHPDIKKWEKMTT